MSHRIKRFAAFAIFALFYLVSAVDSILGFYRHQTDTKKTPKPAPQRQDQVYQMKVVFGVLSTLTEEKSSSSRSSLLRRARGDERDADLYLPGVRFAATRTDVI